MMQVVHQLFAVFDEADSVFQPRLMQGFRGHQAIIRVIVGHQDFDQLFTVVHVTTPSVCFNGNFATNTAP